MKPSIQPYSVIASAGAARSVTGAPITERKGVCVFVLLLFHVLGVRAEGCLRVAFFSSSFSSAPNIYSVITSPTLCMFLSWVSLTGIRNCVDYLEWRSSFKGFATVQTTVLIAI
jgi:hypothetical protein